MVWGAFANTKKCELVILKGNQNAVRYKQTLEDYLLPFVDQELGDSWVFQQDVASIHRAHIVQERFHEEDIATMNWQAKSPDLNPIENLWGILARKLYRNTRQFGNVEDLRGCVLAEWDAIPDQIFENLVGQCRRDA